MLSTRDEVRLRPGVVGSMGTCLGADILDLAFRKKSLFAGGEWGGGGPHCSVHLRKLMVAGKGNGEKEHSEGLVGLESLAWADG